MNQHTSAHERLTETLDAIEAKLTLIEQEHTSLDAQLEAKRAQVASLRLELEELEEMRDISRQIIEDHRSAFERLAK
jgi:archaellum component FlaC